MFRKTAEHPCTRPRAPAGISSDCPRLHPSALENSPQSGEMQLDPIRQKRSQHAADLPDGFSQAQISFCTERQRIADGAVDADFKIWTLVAVRYSDLFGLFSSPTLPLHQQWGPI